MLTFPTGFHQELVLQQHHNKLEFLTYLKMALHVCLHFSVSVMKCPFPPLTVDQTTG